MSRKCVVSTSKNSLKDLRAEVLSGSGFRNTYMKTLESTIVIRQADPPYETLQLLVYALPNQAPPRGPSRASHSAQSHCRHCLDWKRCARPGIRVVSCLYPALVARRLRLPAWRAGLVPRSAPHASRQNLVHRNRHPRRRPGPRDPSRPRPRDCSVRYASASGDQS